MLTVSFRRSTNRLSVAVAAGCAWLAAAGAQEPAVDARGLARAADLSATVFAAFDALLSGDHPEAADGGRYLVPRMGRVWSARSEASGYPASFRVPKAISVILWTSLPKSQASALLFGMGERDGDYLTLATDTVGAPLVVLFDAAEPSIICRAKSGAADLADGRRHSVALVVNLDSGLVRLYVDGQPEAAALSSFWRPEFVGRAFALAAKKGDATGAPFGPRILARELTDDELASLQAGIAPGFSKADGLTIEFVPCLRKLRPSS